jgi:hypothetical protein
MFMYPIYYHNWRNISTVYIYNKTGIKRNILTIKKIHQEVGRAKDFSAPPVPLHYRPQIYNVPKRNLYISPLKTKRRPLYLKTQSVPRSKRFSSRL